MAECGKLKGDNKPEQEPKGAKSFDEWDPRQDDFECQKFNTYDRGPGQFLPSKVDRSKTDGIQLYISGIPNDLTEDGLYNLFSQAGSCLRSKKCVSKNPDAGDTYGFVTMGSVADADNALARFNNFNIGRFRMRVRIAMSEEEMRKRKEKKLEEENFIKSLPSQQSKVRAAGTSSDTDSCSSGSQSKMNGRSKGRINSKPELSNGHSIDKASAQHYPHGVAGGYPYENGNNNAFGPAGGLGILGQAPNVPHHSEGYHPSENELKSADPAVLLCQKSTTLNERFTVIENIMPGQGSAHGRGRGYFGGGRRGRGEHHFQIPYYEELEYQGGYGRGYDCGYGRGGHGYHQPNYFGPGQGNFPRNAQMGYGRGIPPQNQNFRGARRGGGFQQHYQGPFQAPADCRPQYHHGSMESLNSMAGVSRPKQMNKIHPCALCEQPGSYQCSRCKTSYCSPECQEAHWHDHKERCKEIQKFHKQVEQENEEFGEISIGDDLIQKMVAGGALEKIEVKVTDNKSVSKVIKETPKKTPAKSNKSAKSDKTSPKYDKSPSAKGKSPSAKTSPSQQEVPAATSMVPLQVQRRVETKEAAKSPPPPHSQQAQGKAIKDSELPVGTDVEVCVSEVVDPHAIWVQLYQQDNITALTHLMQEMKTFYETTNNYVVSPVVGDNYAAEFSMDGNWYRAKVTALQGSDQVAVTYIDYGNSETVGLCKLRQLKDEMTLLPAAVMKCSLAGVKPKTPESWKEAVELLKSLLPPSSQSERLYIIKVLSKLEDCYTVSVLDQNGEDIREKLVKAGVVLEVPYKAVEASPVAEAGSCPVPYSTLPLNEKVLVLTMEVVSPGEIWVQEGVEKKIQHGMQITESLNKVVCRQLLKPVTDVKPGEMYAAYSAKDVGWYRARADRVKEDGTILVTYLEFGNQESVSLSQMQELVDFLKIEPVTGVHLMLDGIAPLAGEQSWSDNAKATLRELVQPTAVSQNKYMAEAVERSASSTTVRLADMDGTDIAEKLIEAGVVRRIGATASESVAVSQNQESEEPKAGIKRISVMAKSLGSVADKLSPNDIIPVMMTDVTSPANFVIQLNLDEFIRPFAAFSLELNQTMETVTAGYRPEKVGELVLGLYEGGWYRGEVIRLTDNEAEVYFIDFGNRELKEFSQLTAAIETCNSLPAQSVQCCLHGVTVPEVWPAEILQVFSDLAANPQEAEFKCMVDNVAMIDLKAGEEKMSVSEVIQLALVDLQPEAAEAAVSAAPTVEETSIPTKTDQGAIPKVDTSPGQQKMVPFMASDISSEALPITIEEAVISFIVDFESFYIQLVKSHTKRTELQQSILTYCDSASPYTPVQGELICAKYYGDWYRAKVLEVLEEGQFNTQFVDYGNCDEVSTDSIRKMTAAFKSLPCQSIHCKLHGVTNEGQSQETLQAFAHLVGECKVQVEAKQCDNGVYSILLTTADGVDVNERFQVKDVSPLQVNDPAPRQVNNASPGQVNDATPKQVNDASPGQVKGATSTHQLSPHPEEQHKGNFKLSEIKKFVPKEKQFEIVISYVVNPEEFYCQITAEENIQALTLLLQNIMLHCEMENINPTFNPQVGDLCCAQFTDKSWYRASVEQIFPDNTLLVHFVDFGNTEVVSRENIRPIQPEYTELNITAFKCSLQGLKPVGEAWSQEVTVKLNEFCNEKLTLDIIEKVGDVYVVELSAGGNRISDFLVESGLATRPAENEEEDDEAARIAEQIAALQAQLFKVKSKKS